MSVPISVYFVSWNDYKIRRTFVEEITETHIRTSQGVEPRYQSNGAYFRSLEIAQRIVECIKGDDEIIKSKNNR